MHMSYFNKDEALINNYSKIYDIKSKKVKICIGFVIVLIIFSILEPAPASYLQSIREGYRLRSCDNIYDYVVPLITMFIISYVFYDDYKDNTFQIIAFYNSKKYNSIMLYRIIKPFAILLLGVSISALIYYRNVSFLDINSIVLSIRFIPNILFICSLLMFFTVITKSIYTGIFISIAYYLVDFTSDGRLFKIFSIGANVNNIYYLISPTYYFINRIVLLVLSCILIYSTLKKSAYI